MTRLAVLCRVFPKIEFMRSIVLSIGAALVFGNRGKDCRRRSEQQGAKRREIQDWLMEQTHRPA